MPTYAKSSQQPDCLLRLITLRKERLDDIVGKGQCHNGGGAGSDDHALHPEPQEGWQGPESLSDVSVICPGFHDARTQFCVAVGSDHGKQSASQPHSQGHTHRSNLLKDALGTNEDARSYDAAYDDRYSIKEGDLPFQFHGTG